MSVDTVTTYRYRISVLLLCGSDPDAVARSLMDVVHALGDESFEILLLLSDWQAVEHLLGALEGDVQFLDVSTLDDAEFSVAALRASGQFVISLRAGEVVDPEAVTAALESRQETFGRTAVAVGAPYELPNALRAEARARLQANETVLSAFEDAVQAAVTADNLPLAASLAQTAGDIAWHNHPGRHTSSAIEQALTSAGRVAAGNRRRSYVPAPAGGVARVLHVLTEGYPVGGHTRLAWRWIEADRDREHSVVLARQRGALPERLRTAAEQSGGRLFRLDDPVGDVVDRARMLRALAGDADAVILHVHPFDVLPLLAFADSTARPPIAFLDHADHAFWYGASIADLMISVRSSVLGFAQRRRGIPPARQAVLPLPIDPQPRNLAREAAKEQLGLPADATVLLTVAQPHKFARVDDCSYLDLVLPHLIERPDVHLVAVGPSADGDWSTARTATGGRVHALGLQPDVRRFYEAADVYLDSFPYASTTSATEAAALGVPVLAFTPHRLLAPPIYSDLPGAGDDLVQRAATPEQFGAVLRRWLDDVPGAWDSGARLAEALLDTAEGPLWSQALTDIYGRLLRTPRGTMSIAARTRRPDIADELFIRVAGAAHDTVKVVEAAGRHGLDVAAIAPFLQDRGLDAWSI